MVGERRSGPIAVGRKLFVAHSSGAIPLPNPRKVGKPRTHHAAMPYADLPAFMARLGEIDTLAARALMFTILTAARSGEVLKMTFDEINFDTATWSLPASRMKMKREFSVPLSSATLDILRAQEFLHRSNPFVFPGRPMKPLSAMTMAMTMKRMGAGGAFTVHGMRSSFRMWAADVAHAPFEVAEQCLAHVTGSAVVQAYQRSSMLERRRPLMQSWADYVTGKLPWSTWAACGRARSAFSPLSSEASTV